MSKSVERDYANMTMKETVEAVIEDSKLQGTVTLPLRRDGYHTCCNLVYTNED